MSKIADWVKGLEIPETRLTRPEEMKGNPNHAAKNPASLLLDFRTSHPLVPPMVPYHPAMKERIELEKLKRFIDQMFSTDANLHRAYLEAARANEQASRIEKRRAAETMAADKHAETVVQGELDRRIFYFQRQLKRMLKQENLNAETRRHMLELFEFLRTRTVEHADKYNKETLKAIRDGEKRHEEYWAFRLDNLWAATGTGGITKLKNHGEMIGKVTGRIDGQEKERITAEHWQWRKDNVFITQPNGALTRADNGMGVAPESAAAKIHQPVIDERSEAFRDWRASDSYVTTPNGSLMHMKDQGKQPEGAFAWLSIPKKAEVTLAHAEERKWDMSGQTPNGGSAPLYNSGATQEAVSAKLYWPLRHDITQNHVDWQKSYMFAPTANGSWHILAGVGKSPEHTAAVVEQPKKDQITDNFSDWRKNNLWQSTPNGGYARLKSVGESMERMSFEFDIPKKEGMTRYHEQKEANNRYVVTSNHSWGRLSDVGGQVEDITGKVDAPKKDKIVEYFDERDDNNLFTPTSNGGIGRRPNIGDGIEKTAHDVHAPRDAKTMTSVKQFVHNEHDSSVDNGTGTPLATNGRQSEEAQNASTQRNDARKAHNFRELKKTLAAFEQTTSAFAMHAVATKPQPIEVPEPPASNSAVPAATSTAINKKAV